MTHFEGGCRGDPAGIVYDKEYSDLHVGVVYVKKVIPFKTTTPSN